MKQSPLELAGEMREVLNTLSAVKGPQYAAIVESTLNQANLAVGWGILVDDMLKSEVMQMYVLCDTIIQTNVSLMVSLWQTSNLSPGNADPEEVIYARCQQLNKDIQVDVKMLQAKQREYSSAAS